MPTIGILDHSHGIQTVMDMPNLDKLPQARDTGATPLKEAGLDELYAPVNARSYVEKLLCPDVGDGSVLSPEAFADQMESCIAELSGSDDPNVKGMLQELKNLQRNGTLYQAYVGLMIGG
jgi:type III secretion protein X